MTDITDDRGYSVAKAEPIFQICPAVNGKWSLNKKNIRFIVGHWYAEYYSIKADYESLDAALTDAEHLQKKPIFVEDKP